MHSSLLAPCSFARAFQSPEKPLFIDSSDASIEKLSHYIWIWFDLHVRFSICFFVLFEMHVPFDF